MSQIHHALAILSIVAITGAGVACKTRDPNSAGLLESRPMTGNDSKATAWEVTCAPAQQDGASVDPDMIYTFSIAGGVSEFDDSQPVLVTVTKRSKTNGTMTSVSTGESGRGAVSPKGSIFVGFPTGVLTANFSGASSGVSTHTGLMTLQDEAITAVEVECEVQTRSL